MGTVNCMRCRFRHEDNGNCTAVGGFCTAVQAAHCPLLRAYLDTELTPELVQETAELAVWVHENGLDKIKEWVKAGKDGRVMVLPCKEGDVVFGIHNEQTILPMVAKWFETNDDGWTVAAQYAPMAPKFYKFSDFGKTVFLTRDEAQAALAAERICPHRKRGK